MKRFGDGGGQRDEIKPEGPTGGLQESAFIYISQRGSVCSNETWGPNGVCNDDRVDTSMTQDVIQRVRDRG